ncbi:MAG: sulfite exporter TauE/SafE family protein [Chloroflexi bacterium]|nr:sulfite exporter TauE/SafE family protein [Chloroflexota bacterium]
MELGLGVLLGLVAGLVGGVMGIGGGMILVPALVLLAGLEQHAAQGVSLAVVAATSLVGAIAHYRQGTVRPATVVWVAPGAVLFGFLGAQLAGWLDAGTLRHIFAGVVFTMSLLMVLGQGSE